MISYDMPMADYLKHPGVGSSSLKNILMSPRDYKAALAIPSKDTASTLLGELTHTFMLERDKFDERYVVQPEDWGPKNKGEAKKKWDALKKKAKEEGKQHVSWEEKSFLDRLDGEMKSHIPLQAILNQGHPEVTVTCEHKGIVYKAREDWIASDDWVWDVKTSVKMADDDTLARTIFLMGYHFQAAHHMFVLKNAGIDVKGWGWIFVSTGTPHPHIILRRASKELLEAGRTDHSYARNLLEACTRDNHWPGFPQTPVEIGLPQWAEGDYE